MEEIGQIAPLPEAILELVARPSSPSKIAGNSGHILDGQRNATLTSFAGTMRRRGMSEEAILAALLQENATRCDPPLEEKEVRIIAHSIARYSPEPYSPSSPYSPASVSYKWPAPMNDRAYHGLAGEFVRLVDPHTEADPAALLVQFLVAFGNVIGRGPHFVAEADQHHANLFAVMVGETAKGRKGSSWGHVRERMHAIDPEWTVDRVQTGLSSGEGLIWAVRDLIQQRMPVRQKGRVVDYEIVETDPGVSDKRLLAMQPEFATTLRVFERDGNSLSGVVRQAWDTGVLRILTKNNPAKATGAHISALGHITKEELCRYLDRTEIGNGFANRILFICVRRSKVLPEGGRIGSVDFGPLDRKIREAVEASHRFGGIALERDDEARKLWREVYENLSEGKPGLFGAITSRAEAQVMRLALIYALLDQASGIGKRHLEAGLEVWRYAEDSARYIFGDSLGSPVADEVLSILRANPEGLTRTELSSRLFGHHKSSNLGATLTLLQSRRLIRSEQVQTSGRWTERWYAVGEEGDYGGNAPPAAIPSSNGAHPAPDSVEGINKIKAIFPGSLMPKK